MFNIIYAQSGGMTPVINNSAASLIRTAQKHSDKINKIYAAKNGIIGLIENRIVDVTELSEKELSLIGNTSGGIFGTCRYKLKEDDYETYEKIYNTLKEYDIKCIFYNGGNDSADTSNKLCKIKEYFDYDLICIGIPKTIDNDLPFTDVCPGFPSSAKYVAISMLESSTDLKSMCLTSTKVTIIEIMGRHAGWLTAASSVWKKKESDSPHICLLPEVEFNEDKFLELVKYFKEKYGYCTIAVSEGIKDGSGNFVANSKNVDSFGHKQLGGVGIQLSNLITTSLKYKCHCMIPDYLQRSCTHLSTPIDIELAKAVGRSAVEYALEGKNNVMPMIVRKNSTPFEYEIVDIELSKIANVEKKLPANYIKENGYEITKECRDYLKPYVFDENFSLYQDEEGKPIYFELD